MRTFTTVLGILFLLIWAAVSVAFAIFLILAKSHIEFSHTRRETHQLITGQGEAIQTSDEMTVKPVVEPNFNIFNSPEAP